MITLQSMSKDPALHQVDYANFGNLLKMVNYWNSWLDHPVSRIFYGNGLYAWILIAMIGYALRHRSLRAVLGLVPHIVLMLGLFVSHVNGLLRYGYPLIAATPLIGGYTFYAVSRKRAAPLAAPAASAPASPLPVLSGLRSLLARAFGKLTRLLKGAIRKICYFVLHLVEDKKE